MNRTWISHGSWQSCGRKTGVGAGRWVGWLANWQEGERAGLCWCLLLGGAAQSRMKHEDRRQRSGQLKRWAGPGCDHRHWQCEDLLKEIEEGGWEDEIWQHPLTAADATKKSEARSSLLRFSPASVKKQDAETLKIVWQFQASAAQITINSNLV